LEVLETLDFDIRFFYRYVDDIVIVVPTTMINAMLDKFNLLHPRLQFILEVGIDRINFLDTTIIISNNIKFDWYQKPTFSGKYLNFLSQHPLS